MEDQRARRLVYRHLVYRGQIPLLAPVHVLDHPLVGLGGLAFQASVRP